MARRTRSRGVQRFGRLGAWLFLGAVLVLYALEERPRDGAAPDERRPPVAAEAGRRDDAPDPGAVARAFAAGRSDVQVLARGVVGRILADDNEGSRHQRFLVDLEGDHRILVSHNIDLAPRLDGLRVGDRVAVYGEFEWNELGGVVHWTHHDPAGRHPDGWIEWEGRRYQ